MHTRISDLLDGWEDGSAELPVPAGMSPERIREMTMKKVKESGRPRRRMGLRLLACAGLAAVFTVSAMAAYQLWGPGELFDPFFTIESAPLNDGQKALLDEIGTTDLPPVTSGGTTLTPLAAIADEHTLYLRLRLEAPEGTVLPDMGSRKATSAHDIQLVDTETGEQLNWGFQKARFLPDDTPGDNTVELVFMLLGFPWGANWIDGVPKTLTITGLGLHPGGVESMHLEGEWSFSLDGFYPSKAVEVNTIGAARWDETTERMVTLEGLTLSPLSAAFTTSYPTWGDEWGVFTNLEIELVFQDGSTVVIDGGNGGTSPGPDGDGGVVYFTGVHSFDTPLDLTQLDHIQFGEYRLELPGAPRQTVEVDTAGAVWHDEAGQGTLTLEELSFSSLSLDYCITYDNPEAVDLTDLGIYLVLTDGGRVSVDCGTGFPASGSIQGTSYFDAPVPLEQVDHVLFGDIRLELPAAEP